MRRPSHGASGLDVYGWLGSLATYGFIGTYALASISLPRYLREVGALHTGSQFIPVFAFIAMLLALAGNLYPIPEGPYGKLPFIYLAYLAVGMIWLFYRCKSPPPCWLAASLPALYSAPPATRR